MMKKQKYKLAISYTANLITCIRIVCSFILLFFPTASAGFYIFYLIGGFSDILDGFVARKTNTVSQFGAKLDSIADLIFTAVCLIKLLPEIYLPIWLWIWIAVILFIRIINVICGYIYQKRLVMLHTAANKITGILLFSVPLILPFAEFKYIASFVALFATFAAIREGHFIRTGRTEEK